MTLIVSNSLSFEQMRVISMAEFFQNLSCVNVLKKVDFHFHFYFFTLHLFVYFLTFQRVTVWLKVMFRSPTSDGLCIECFPFFICFVPLTRMQEDVVSFHFSVVYMRTHIGPKETASVDLQKPNQWHCEENNFALVKLKLTNGKILLFSVHNGDINLILTNNLSMRFFVWILSSF